MDNRRADTEVHGECQGQGKVGEEMRETEVWLERMELETKEDELEEFERKDVDELEDLERKAVVEPEELERKEWDDEL